ncbi:MAG: M15 family metallopeptidase [Burkholderiaceae bacterium]
MKPQELIGAVQERLHVSVDGKAGPETWGAIFSRITEQPAAKTAELIGEVDPRSERIIATLLPEVRPHARSLVHKAASIGITIKIISGTRTYAEQDALYAKGRTVPPGPIVTNARGGYSNHNFGIAFDIGVFEGSKYLTESPKYAAVGALGMDMGLDWGGNWKSLVDMPHFQLRPTWATGLNDRTMLAELRSRVKSGRSLYA